MDNETKIQQAVNVLEKIIKEYIDVGIKDADIRRKEFISGKIDGAVEILAIFAPKETRKALEEYFPAFSQFRSLC